MKLKKTIIMLTLLTFSFGVIGCSKSQEVDNGSNSSKEYSFDKVELNKDNIFAFGIEQTKNIENVVKKYGVTTTHNVEESEGAQMTFLEDEEGKYDKDKGYVINTPKNISVKDGGDNAYIVNFGVKIKEDEKVISNMLIEIQYPLSQEFKFDNFMMFKEILKETFSESCDLAVLESSIKDLISTVPSGGKRNSANIQVGDFLQNIIFYNNREGKNKLVFFLIKS